MKLNQILAVMAVVTSFSSFAGGDAGNGGDAVVCPGRVYMLDTYEVESKGNKTQFREGTLRQKVQGAISRLEDKDPELSEKILGRAEVLLKDIESYQVGRIAWQANTEFTQDTLVNISDEGAASVPKGCEIEQLIIQRIKPMREDKKFMVQAELWDRMEVDEKAAAVIHESLYGYLLEKEVNNSLTTRYFNGLIMRDEFKNMSDKKYFELLKELEFSELIHTNFGLKFNDFAIKYDELGNIERIEAAEFVKPLIETYLTSGGWFKIGLINGKRAWISGLAGNRNYISFFDVDAKKTLPTPSMWLSTGAYKVPKEVYDQFELGRKNIKIFVLESNLRQTEFGYEVGSAGVRFEKIFLNGYRFVPTKGAYLVFNHKGEFLEAREVK